MTRVALGCQRASSEALFEAAIDAGITTFDTARAYGESERALGNFLRARSTNVRVVTKGGMAEGWRPDGRARALRDDLDASLEALGVPIDTYLVHAPDPNVPWTTTMRALAKIREEKLVARVGVCNVTRRQLDEALDVAPDRGRAGRARRGLERRASRRRRRAVHRARDRGDGALAARRSAEARRSSGATSRCERSRGVTTARRRTS